MRRSLSLPLIALTALTLTACGGRDVRSFEEVEQDFENPSGTVDADSAPGVFGQAVEAGDAEASASMAAAFDTTGTLGGALLSETEALAWNREALMEEGCNVHVDANGQGQVRTIEVECDDHVEYDGSFLMEFEYDGAEVGAIWLDFGMWCTPEGCVDGSMGFRFRLSGDAGTGMTMTLLSTARLELHENGEVTRVEWGLRMTSDDTSASVEWLVYGEHDGRTRSWVLSAAADATGGTLEVRGANGTFSCTYAAAGESGECTGPEGNTFSWSA